MSRRCHVPYSASREYNEFPGSVTPVHWCFNSSQRVSTVGLPRCTSKLRPRGRNTEYEAMRRTFTCKPAEMLAIDLSRSQSPCTSLCHPNDKQPVCCPITSDCACFLRIISVHVDQYDTVSAGMDIHWSTPGKTSIYVLSSATPPLCDWCDADLSGMEPYRKRTQKVLQRTDPSRFFLFLFTSFVFKISLCKQYRSIAHV